MDRSAAATNRYLPMLAMMAGAVVLLHVLAAAVVLMVVARGEGIGDWVAFYAAGTMVRTGHGASLYDAAAEVALQRSLFGDGVRAFGYPQPAFAAYAFAPLSRLSFAASYGAWFAVNVALAAMLARAAWRHLDTVPRRLRLAFVACAGLSTPLVNTLLLGQLDLVVLTAMAGCYALLARGRPFGAGALLALALVKPHIAAAAVLLLAVKGEWRALAGFAAAGAPLLLAPVVLLGPGIVGDQARLLASFPGASTGLSVMAPMMVNVRGAVTSLTGSSSAWLWGPPLVIIAAVAVAVAVRTWRGRPATDAQSWALVFALPLLYSPHLHIQTMVLLLASGALFVRARSEAGNPPPVEAVLAAYVAVACLWLLAIAGAALMFVPILLAYGVLVRDWPRPAEARAESGALPLAA